MSVKPNIRTLIVDDEPLARERIREMLSSDPEIEIVGECATGRDAVAAIRECTPDLLFLDVQMPQMDGFAVLKALGPDRMPVVVFVTAYDRYAVQAFEVYALDYVLKPFKRRRFKEALQRAKNQIQRERISDFGERALALLGAIETKPKYMERLVIKTSGKALFIRTDEIDWIKAEDNYVRLHIGKQSYLLRERLSNLETQLDPKKFLRVHRCTIVNIDRIRELQPWFHRDYRVVLRDGTELPLSRNYRTRLREVLQL